MHIIRGQSDAVWFTKREPLRLVGILKGKMSGILAPPKGVYHNLTDEKPNGDAASHGDHTQS
jgi:hypothetical protein